MACARGNACYENMMTPRPGGFQLLPNSGTSILLVSSRSPSLKTRRTRSLAGTVTDKLCYTLTSQLSCGSRSTCTVAPLTSSHRHHRWKGRSNTSLFSSRILADPQRVSFPHNSANRANMSSQLIPSNPADLMVIRNITPNIVTFSVPFSRFGRIKIGGRGTLGKPV